jgi:hypothetical protein
LTTKGAKNTKDAESRSIRIRRRRPAAALAR